MSSEEPDLEEEVAPDYDAVVAHSQRLDPTCIGSYHRCFRLMTFRSAMEGLSEKNLAILDLVLYGNYTITEAAARLGLARMTVFDRFRAAIDELRWNLKNDPDCHRLLQEFEELEEC